MDEAHTNAQCRFRMYSKPTSTSHHEPHMRVPFARLGIHNAEGGDDEVVHRERHRGARSDVEYRHLP